MEGETLSSLRGIWHFILTLTYTACGAWGHAPSKRNEWSIVF